MTVSSSPDRHCLDESCEGGEREKERESVGESTLQGSIEEHDRVNP